MTQDDRRVPRPHQEWDQAERCLIGRDPRHMTQDELHACGIAAAPLLAAVRAKCLDCVGHSPAEVRRCGDINCALWPFRMSANPWRAKRQLSEEQREQAVARLNQARPADRALSFREETEVEVAEVME